MKRLEKLVKNRIVCVVLHGKSISKLENRIKEFKNLDICWISLNTFDMIEKYILNKIDESLDVIFRFALHRGSIEKDIQAPLIEKAIEKNCLIVGTKKLFVEDYHNIGLSSFYNTYNNKILFLDNILDKNKEGLLQSLVKPPQISLPTLCYIIYCLAIAKADTIILFGCDGCNDNESLIDSYYKPVMRVKRRLLPSDNLKELPDGFITSINYDTKDINKYFHEQYNICKKNYNLTTLPKILNCSPNSKINVFNTINYNEAIKICQSGF